MIVKLHAWFDGKYYLWLLPDKKPPKDFQRRKQKDKNIVLGDQWSGKNLEKK